MKWTVDPEKYQSRLDQALVYHSAGKITKSMGLIYEAHLPGAAVGSICRILASDDPANERGVDAEVIGFRDKRVMLMPFEDPTGVNNESLVVLRERTSSITVGD